MKGLGSAITLALVVGLLTSSAVGVAAQDATATSRIELHGELGLDVLELEWAPLDLDEATFGPGARLVDIAASDSMLVIGGSVDGSAAVWTSTDGLDWERVPHDEAVFGGPADHEIKAIVPWRDGFVAAGEVGGVGDFHRQRVAAVWVSEDGTTWTRVPHDEKVFGGKGRQEMFDIAATDDRLAIVGFDEAGPCCTDRRADHDIAVWTSADGFDWKKRTFGRGEMLAVEGTPEGFVGVGHRGMWTSEDGTRWERTGPGRSTWMPGLTQTPGGFVAVGASAGDRPAAWTSADGATWAPATIDAPSTIDAPFGDAEWWGLNDVAFADSGLAAVAGPGITGGSSAILVSRDGTTWGNGDAPVGIADACLGGIASFGSHFVAIGPGRTRCQAASSIWKTFEHDGTAPEEQAGSDDEATATLDLLPGVDLVTEEVAPGVLKVIGHEGVHAIAVGDDGTVRVSKRGGIFELDQQGERLGDALTHGYGLLMPAADGTLWAASTRPPNVRSFDGQTWTRYDTGPWDYINDFAVHPDGTVWQLGAMDDPDANISLEQLGPGGWTIHDISDELSRLGCGDRCGEGSIEITPDGAVWLGVTRGGLLRFDGTEWEVVRPLGGDEDHSVIFLAANRDGILWAEIETGSGQRWVPSRLGEGRALARFDGQDWEVFDSAPSWDTSHAPDSEHPGPFAIQAVSPDGMVWLIERHPDTDWGARLKDLRSQGTEAGTFPVSFDGERWTRHDEVQAGWIDDPLNDNGWHLEEFGEWRITVGPDGTAWANVSGWDAPGSLIYVITPEAMAAAETVAVEPAEEAEPTGDTTTPDLLPGVDLVTEEVEPGVERIVSDGIRDLSVVGLERSELAVATDGTVWLYTSPPDPDPMLWEDATLVRLGDPDSYVEGVAHWPQLKVSPDGTLWATEGDGIHRLGDEGWSKVAATRGSVAAK